MNLLRRIRDYFSPPALRNKPGGMAYIKGVWAQSELNGRVVQTVRIEDGTKWRIEPMQLVICTPGLLFSDTGRRSLGGEKGLVTAVEDDCLTPLADPGEDARDESLAWLPPVPVKAKEPEVAAMVTQAERKGRG